MNNRLATLPLWGFGNAPGSGWQFAIQGAAARSRGSQFALDGPMAAGVAHRSLDGSLAALIVGFVDGLRFSGGPDSRPLQVRFTRPPLALPADALFADLHGTYRSEGMGLALTLKRNGGRLGEHQWVAGVLAQRVSLRDYRASYRVLDGLSSGTSGIVDYSSSAVFAVPFAGLAVTRHFGAWSVTPHALLAQALPRRGFSGRITGPGFDLSGDTGSAGNGKHFGDPSLTLGVDTTYLPWGLTLNVGTLVSTALLEPVLHKGIDKDWVFSINKQF